jgi:hypothetical protein
VGQRGEFEIVQNAGQRPNLAIQRRCDKRVPRRPNVRGKSAQFLHPRGTVLATDHTQHHFVVVCVEAASYRRSGYRATVNCTVPSSHGGGVRRKSSRAICEVNVARTNSSRVGERTHCTPRDRIDPTASRGPLRRRHRLVRVEYLQRDIGSIRQAAARSTSSGR